jgi:hypothetical protein
MRKGVLFDDTGDLQIKARRNAQGKIVSGLVIGDVTAQNQRTILLAEKGEIKEAPLLGVGTQSFIDDDEPADFFREVRTNLRMDGQTVKEVGFNETGKLVITAFY